MYWPNSQGETKHEMASVVPEEKKASEHTTIRPHNLDLKNLYRLPAMVARPKSLQNRSTFSPNSTTSGDDNRFFELRLGSTLKRSQCKWTLVSIVEKNHINHLETRAIKLELKAFLYPIRGKHVLIMTGNTTAMPYIRKEGGIHSKRLYEEAIQIHALAAKHQVTISLGHLPGSQNIATDWLSRLGHDSHEWELNPVIVKTLFQTWWTAQVDLFVAHSNSKFSQYSSRVALGRDSARFTCGVCQQ